MKIIEYKWSREINNGAFWISEKDYEEQIKNIAPYNWEVDTHKEYDDQPGYTIQLCSSADKPFAQIVIEEIIKLIQQGFSLSDKAQKQYEYWGKRYAEQRASTLEIREEERKRLEQEKKGQEKTKIFQWCDKHGCQTKIEICDSCKLKIITGCKPRNIMARLNEKGQWVGAV